MEFLQDKYLYLPYSPHSFGKPQDKSPEWAQECPFKLYAQEPAKIFCHGASCIPFRADKQ